jgi:hypothetical protein
VIVLSISAVFVRMRGAFVPVEVGLDGASGAASYGTLLSVASKMLSADMTGESGCRARGNEGFREASMDEGEGEGEVGYSSLSSTSSSEVRPAYLFSYR